MESGGDLLPGGAMVLNSIHRLRSNSGAMSRRKVCCATWSSFQISAEADSTRLDRVAAVVRSRTAANGNSTTFAINQGQVEVARI